MNKTFKDFDLQPYLIEAVEALGFKEPTELQKEVIKNYSTSTTSSFISSLVTLALPTSIYSYICIESADIISAFKSLAIFIDNSI